MRNLNTFRKTLFSELAFVNFDLFTEEEIFIYLMSGNNGDIEIISPVTKFAAYNLRFK